MTTNKKAAKKAAVKVAKKTRRDVTLIVSRTETPSTLRGARAEVYKRITNGMTVAALQTKMVKYFKTPAWKKHTWQVLEAAAAQGFVTIGKAKKAVAEKAAAAA
jgi:hypothetical protein